MKIHVFDVDKLSRRVLGRTWPNLGAKKAENDPKLAPQNDPKSVQNRYRKMVKFSIDFWSIFGRQEARTGRLEIDQNFDHFLDSIFGRFGVVLGRQVGVIFGTFGAQDAPSSVQNAS